MPESSDGFIGAASDDDDDDADNMKAIETMMRYFTDERWHVCSPGTVCFGN